MTCITPAQRIELHHQQVIPARGCPCRILLVGRTVTESGCWEWTGWRNWGGYGGCDRYGQRSAHRAVYVCLVGPIPDGLDLDHLCRNRPCCNPAHLEPVTRQENLLRSPLVGRQHGLKTHCNYGHERTPENSYFKADGARHCKVCAYERYHSRQRAT